MVLLNLALAGAGITLQPKHAVTPYLENGQLVELLPDYEPQALGIYGIYRSRRHMPQALRLFIDELVDYLSYIDM